MYRLTANPSVVQRAADGAWIPADPRNKDWREYQAWREAGGVPEPYEAPAAPRIVSGTDFLALWVPAEIEAAFAADARLMAGALKVAAQGRANLDSAECAALLALAEAKGVLTAARRERIASGQPPA